MKRSISILLMAALLLTGILPVRTSGQSREGSLITQNRICSDTGETPEVSECQHTFGAWKREAATAVSARNAVPPNPAPIPGMTEP